MNWKRIVYATACGAITVSTFYYGWAFADWLSHASVLQILCIGAVSIGAGGGYIKWKGEK